MDEYISFYKRRIMVEMATDSSGSNRHLKGNQSVIQSVSHSVS